MSEANLKDFLACGALLQTAQDSFKLLLGPFKPCTSPAEGLLLSDVLLYKPDFWTFLSDKSKPEQKTVYSCRKSFSFNRGELIEWLGQTSSEKPEISWSAPTEADFKAQFDWSFRLFKEKILKKTVPIICQKGVGQWSIQNKVYVLQKLLEIKNPGWAYAYFDEQSAMIGHTPESLCIWDLKSKTLRTMALAGTYAKTPEAFEKILKDQKNRQEHEFVVEDMKTQLSGLKGLSVGETGIQELQYILHLKTELTLPVESQSEALNVIGRLHPTSAMAMYPRKPELLAEFSGFNTQKDRKDFASPFAFVEADRVTCVVAIRSLKFSGHTTEIFSGCGITIESQYESELSELETKRNSVKKMLGLGHD